MCSTQKPGRRKEKVAEKNQMGGQYGNNKQRERGTALVGEILEELIGR